MPQQHKVVANPDFRADPNRCVEIFSEFTEELAARLIPRINQLRFGPDGAKPITVYINSRGGFTRVLNIIHGSLGCRDQDGRVPTVITVASGDVASAAAYLLTFGDYAIAYPHSVIHFHGVRASEIELTAEDAVGVSRSFTRINRATANKMAKRMIGRITHRYGFSRDRVKAIHRSSLSRKNRHTEVDCFVELMKHKVSPSAAKLLEEARRNLSEMYSLFRGVFPKVGGFGRKTLQTDRDFKVLRALIAHDHQIYRKHGLELDEEGITDLMGDYLMMRDGAMGEHISIIEKSVETWGTTFLSNAEFARYEQKISAGDHALAKKLLIDKATPKARPFFHFAVELCRALLKGENRLSGTDAYWLGVVDEVVGTSMSGARALLENVRDIPEVPSAVSTPSPQKS